MHIIVVAGKESEEEFLNKNVPPGTKVTFCDNIAAAADNNSDSIFIIKEIDAEQLQTLINKPVFINSVVNTLHQLQLPGNFCRFNGWPTFIKRDVWEIAGGDEMHFAIFKELDWKYIAVTDDTGLVAARVISMIINEAWFALGDNISTKQEIDIAMKLGTNYPYGPFEWCEKIGIKNIYTLLKKLSEKDERYIVAPAMENEINN